MFWKQTAVAAAVLGAVACAPALQAEPEPQEFEYHLAGTSGQSYLGVGTAEITSERAKELRLREERGVEITSLEENSPAAKAGLKKGDVVLDYNGQRVEGTEQFVRMVRETPAGREVKLTISRNGVPQTLAVVTGQRRAAQIIRGDGMSFTLPTLPDMPDMPVAPLVMWRNGSMGVEAESLTPQLAQFFGVKEGVLIRSVRQDSAAERAGIKAGDVITKVDGKDVTTPAEITRSIRSMRDKRTFPVTLVREKREMVLTVTIDEDQSAPRVLRPGAALAPISTRTQRL